MILNAMNGVNGTGISSKEQKLPHTTDTAMHMFAVFIFCHMSPIIESN